MKLAIIGAGYVGLTTAVVLAELDHEVTCVEIDEKKLSILTSGKSPIYEEHLQELLNKNIDKGNLRFTNSFKEGLKGASICIIAVGTPTLENWEIDLSQVICVAEELPNHLEDGAIVVLKSTVPAGTNDLVYQMIASRIKGDQVFELVSNPEFLREGQSIYDTFFPDRIVIGVRNGKGIDVMNELYKKIINQDYADKLVPPKRGNERNPVPVVKTNPQTAELIKYAANAFLATKISFINEISRLTECFSANITEVAKGIGLDRRIGESFLQAGIGFGGSCFPKDTKALSYQAVERGYNFPLLKAVIEVNQLQRFRFMQKIIDRLGNIRGKNITILGLAFKPGTDDVRESPGIDIMKNLEFRGAKLRAHDPMAIETARMIIPNGNFITDPYEALKNADAAAIITDWQMYKDLNWAKIKEIMNRPLVFDGRNLLDPATMSDLGFEYFSIGR
ncbi:MAG: UDP-glucose/GDP-mannose dehydrogenase family protein [bacterium]